MEYREKRGTGNRGIKADKCAAAIIEGLNNNNFEIVSPALENLKTATRANLDNLFEKMNGQW
jgi:short-subunit dehydrogenase involved in D-alanine esterification of teichoic acids